MDWNVSARPVEAEIVSSVEQQAQGTISGMLFARVEADLDRHSPWKSPRKAVSKDTGFESPIPHKGIRRARKVVVAGKIRRLLPDALGFRDLLFVKECGDEVIGVGVEGQLGMKVCKAVPDADGICRMAFANLVED